MKRLIWIFAMAIGLSASLNSCYYDKIRPDVIDPDELGDISFSKGVMPIFNQSCNYQGCHATGDVYPDLSPENGYEEIISNGLVNTANPDLSVLYLRLIGNSAGDPMPPGGKLATREINVIRAWITNGAPND